MNGFCPAFAEFAGEFTLELPVAEAFELFSPLGEKLWVPGWSAELLHPTGVEWERGLIFRTRDHNGEAVWIVTALDRDAYEAEYHRVEPHRSVARIRVRCRPRDPLHSIAAVSYAFVGLSDEGNAAVAEMTPDAYAERMKQWERWIAGHVAGRERHE